MPFYFHLFNVIGFSENVYLIFFQFPKSVSFDVGEHGKCSQASETPHNSHAK